MQANFRAEGIMTEDQISLRWFERQLSKLDRRLRKADEKGRIAEVEDIRVRMRGCYCHALSAGAQQREGLFLAEKRYVALSAALCLHLQLKRAGASYIWNGTPAHRF